MGGYNRSGELEVFPETKYGEWIKDNTRETAQERSGR